ncbi:hypothetical protein FRC07_000413 [Ceratobasidium sp. 392]|nr:hypothetical protein FRC07_000413 [Ceratobasidium sp. 392]
MQGAQNRQQQPRHGLFVEPYPHPEAGAPISDERMAPVDLKAYMQSCGTVGLLKNLETAELLMTTGSTDAAKDQHLQSQLYKGNCLWEKTQQLHDDIDKLKHGPEWLVTDINIPEPDGQGARTQYLVNRPVVHVIRELMANPLFRKRMKFAPEKHWTSSKKKNCSFSNMWTANYWRRMQDKRRERGKFDATLVPLLVMTDETKLSKMSGGQKAHPVYLASANTGKRTRQKSKKRVVALLGYLLIDHFEDINNNNERQWMKADLVHWAMEAMLAPLKEVFEDGVKMWCADDWLRRVFPIVAAYLADWPEQNLMSCTSEGSCPICKTKQAGRGDQAKPGKPRNRNETLKVISNYFIWKNKKELTDKGLKTVWPWWAKLPDVNLATCFTPDLLHQLYQGIFKTHMVWWLQYLVGVTELDQQFASTTKAAELTHFLKGISHVKQWTGHESKEMLKQILPLVVGDLEPGEAELMASEIDFIFMAHLASLTETNLQEMEAALETFHQLKDVMVRKGFNELSTRFDRIPKDPEHLHIECAKEPWRTLNKMYMDKWLNWLASGGRETEDDNDRDNPLAIVDDYKSKTKGAAEMTKLVGGGDDEDKAEGITAARGVVGTMSEALPDMTYYLNPDCYMAKQPTRPNLRVKDVIDNYRTLD